MDLSGKPIPRDPWSSISTEELLSELSKRQHGGPAMDGPKPHCGSTMDMGSYNTPLHVGALFLILVLSTTACGLPLMTNRSNKSGFRRKFLFYCQHLGTGVLLATSFIHLLPMAFMSLTNPCLPDFFSRKYTPMAGLIAMIAILSVVTLESYLTGRGAGHVHSPDLWESDDEEEKIPIHTITPSESTLAARRHQYPSAIDLRDLEATEGLVDGISPRPGQTPLPDATPPTNSAARDSTDADSDMDLALDVDELDPQPLDDETHKPLNGQATTGRPRADTDPHIHIPTPDEQKKLFLQCLLLEAGILFHSIFIGMALSVESGPTFLVFLFAIAIHQSFEGLALGSRIAAIHFPRTSLRPWLMVLAFGMTTPVGQAVGLIIHNMYDPQSEAGLLTVGIMNAISAGLLLFAGLVQLLAEDFLSEKSYRTLKGTRRRKAFASVVGGALLMAAVRMIA
ncbi:hypothetical protein SAPIO_CDS1371 [Scedosporium apiospermum]|uniref:ZIP Zinc transporter n=1 Tax=Pseudallescheria apiosperma TaxID=563466 RepID=A0A084GF62_PSEDA|nr:uncharacterized protein SAPIO_CDS1371 [Scedosporium apiospermum]KEZ45974.1 hypothetical protein SAPIO_CDS1371 [Scedosporium apiospermum]